VTSPHPNLLFQRLQLDQEPRTHPGPLSRSRNYFQAPTRQQDEDSGERILSHDKSNYGELQPSVAVSIESAEVPVADGEVSQVGRAQYLGESELNVQDIVGREERSLGATRTAILELAESKGTITPKDVAELLDTSQGSARTYLGRLKKSRDLISANLDTSAPQRPGLLHR
jgi:hypothetical protein